MRAMEARRYLLRATNNGISAVIGSRGELLEVSRQFVPAVIGASVQPLSGETLYVRFGNWPLLATGLVTLIGLLLYRRTWRAR